LSNTYDEPLLPRDFHRLLSLGARIDVWDQKDNVTRKRATEIEYNRVLLRLMDKLSGGPDRIVIPGDSPSPAPLVNLGGQYPRG
jgi:hypothetical protein